MHLVTLFHFFLYGLLHILCFSFRFSFLLFEQTLAGYIRENAGYQHLYILAEFEHVLDQVSVLGRILCKNLPT